MHDIHNEKNANPSITDIKDLQQVYHSASAIIILVFLRKICTVFFKMFILFLTIYDDNK